MDFTYNYFLSYLYSYIKYLKFYKVKLKKLLVEGNHVLCTKLTVFIIDQHWKDCSLCLQFSRRKRRNICKRISQYYEYTIFSVYIFLNSASLSSASGTVYLFFFVVFSSVLFSQFHRPLVFAFIAVHFAICSSPLIFFFLFSVRWSICRVHCAMLHVINPGQKVWIQKIDKLQSRAVGY